MTHLAKKANQPQQQQRPISVPRPRAEPQEVISVQNSNQKSLYQPLVNNGKSVKNRYGSTNQREVAQNNNFVYPQNVYSPQSKSNYNNSDFIKI